MIRGWTALSKVILAADEVESLTSNSSNISETVSKTCSTLFH